MCIYRYVVLLSTYLYLVNLPTDTPKKLKIKHHDFIYKKVMVVAMSIVIR